MYRLLTIVALGVALVLGAVPASAQEIHVDVEVGAGPIAGRVLYGSPHGYPAPPPHHRHPAYDWEYAREQAKYEREMDTEMRLAVVLNPERVWRGITACGLSPGTARRVEDGPTMAR